MIARPETQILRDLIVLAEKVLGRQGSALDLIAPIETLEREILNATSPFTGHSARDLVAGIKHIASDFPTTTFGRSTRRIVCDAALARVRDRFFDVWTKERGKA